MLINSAKQFKEQLKAGPYAWPGGYNKYFITSDGCPLCFDCAKKYRINIIDSLYSGIGDSWEVSGVDINWEDTDLFCDHCGQQIPPSYSQD